MSRLYAIADGYVERYAALHPIAATGMGVPGHDAEMTDFSPPGAEAIAALQRETRAALFEAPVEGERDRVAREAMLERLGLAIELHEAGEHLRDLSILGSPLQAIRGCFDLMPRESEQDWGNIAARLRLVPQGLGGYRRTLDDGLRRDLRSSRRQAAECAAQCEVWSGRAADATPFFDSLLEAHERAGAPGGDSLRGELERGVAIATEAYADMGGYLAERYVPDAEPRDPVGRDRYLLGARVFNGAELDVEETYRWGWDELYWVERELAETAERIAPGRGVEAAKEVLEHDPAGAIEGVEEFRRWMQETQTRRSLRSTARTSTSPSACDASRR